MKLHFNTSRDINLFTAHGEHFVTINHVRHDAPQIGRAHV
jgi:hypothetical protein